MENEQKGPAVKILFVSRKYDRVSGGVERMSILLMNEMRRRGHEVHLLSWDAENASAFYEMDPSIRWHKLSLGDPDYRASTLTKLKRARKARNIVKRIKPDVILAFQDGSFRSIRVYTLGIGCPVIAAERNAPSRFEHTSAGKRKSFTLLFFLLAKKITIQCESYRAEYPSYLRSRIITIPNPVFPAKQYAKMQGEKILLSVGRLEFQKNYKVLLEAFARLQNGFTDWKLIILGEGSERKSLEGFIKGHNLEHVVDLAGETSDVEQYYNKAHLFCLPSLWEGFPNVLAEAMAHGLPCVGFAGCSGVRDLIIPNKNGLLADGINDPQALCESMSILMADIKLRKKMGQAAIDAVKQYEPSKIFDMWEQLFQSVAR